VLTSAKSNPTRLDRFLRSVGLVRQSTSDKAIRTAFAAAAQTRLNADWITSSLSADLELRGGLRKMRQRSRNLANDNDYAERFLKLIVNNVLGANGIGLQAKNVGNKDKLKDDVNAAIELSWGEWGTKKNCAINGRMSWQDVQDLYIRSLVIDGEVFIQKIRGYSKSKHKFAIQFVDPDQVDVNLNKRPSQTGSIIGTNGTVITTTNEIKMGVEIDSDQRVVAYYVIQGHPSEVGRRTYLRVLAQDMLHSFMFRRINQNRGVPWMHTAMLRMGMLSKYEEAELIAARVGASKMGFITSKTGDEYTGEKTESGDLEMTVEPGGIEQLPEGMDFKPWDPNHPNAGFKDFVKTMIRAMAAGLGINYNSLANDLEATNFSSLRAGTLEEREFYKWIQRFMIQNFCQEIFDEWLPMAMLSGALAIPGADPEKFNTIKWRPRGWPWVDPFKDAQASVLLLENNLTTLEEIAAEEGKDWEEMLLQRKKEFDKIKELGLEPIAQPAPKKPLPGKDSGSGTEDTVDNGDENNGDSTSK
jgi:lambda family phage portal protein